MNANMAHRGPDGAGEYHDGHVSMAMRRLSIIDLVGGRQPLYNEERSLVLVANGEIYNFVELRRQLHARGHRFATASDCETILHLYEDHGLDCVQHLRGMFAFALWDGRRRRLVLARDRMGEKPLYLHERDGVLLFASEMKALLASGAVPFELDPVPLNLYFHYQYVPEPVTPVKGVRKLDAAHLLTVDVDPWQVHETCYWHMEEAPRLDGNPAELIRAELQTISELVVRADVPVGVALSGGLDSSAVAALAARKYSGIMHAFSVGYPGRPFYDERGQAQALAAQLGMPFHDIELSTADMVAFFPELVFWRDDPIADISGYGYYAVMQQARQHGVPVMLQGQGGDELFWGYPWVRQGLTDSRQKQRLAEKGWLALPECVSFKGPDHIGLRTFWRWARDGFGVRMDRERYALYRTGPASRMVFIDLTPDYQMAKTDAGALYTAEFRARLEGQDAGDLFTFPLPWPPVDVQITRLICDTYLRENGISQGDRLGMASSIELRLPLVDHKLVETVIGLRKAQPDDCLPPKAWLKAALMDILPDELLNRPKQGFQPPVKDWHRALFAVYGAQLDRGYLVASGVLDPAAGRRLAEGPFPQGAIVPLSFKALVLELWCRRLHQVASQASIEASRTQREPAFAYQPSA